MILTKIHAGLGNQMFQYAFGRSLSLKNNDTLKLDISSFERQTAEGVARREYTLPVFTIAGEIATDSDRAAMKWNIFFTKIREKIDFKFFKRIDLDNVSRLKRARGDVYLHGYWQSDICFNEYAEIIRNDFTLKQPLSLPAQKIQTAITEAATPIALHIRRGDNATMTASMRTFGTPSNDYYLRAPRYIIEKMSVQSPHLFIFSDDISWVKETLTFSWPVTYVSQIGIADYEEIMLMSLCHHFAIANSTFSWWGAWLARFPQKMVVAPEPYALLDNWQYDRLYPNGWERLPR